MEGVEGMLRGLKLSETERRGVCIGRSGGKGGEGEEVRAVGKLMAEKPALAEAMASALGPLWCPMKGITCKDLGENKFLFTFHQASGVRKAVDGGPWMFDKKLLVIEDFDASKSIEDYEFNKIPIWVRVFKIPMGMMSQKTAEDIGDRIGEFLEVDGIENGLAVGKYLRIKVRMLITEPLMRGTMVEVDDEGTTRWCPFEFEYLPDFCFVCGRLGHVDRDCSIKLKRGEKAQFGRWLRWVPPKRMPYGDVRRGWGDDEGGKQRNWSNGGSLLGGGKGRGSDAPSWRKDVNSIEEGGKGSTREEKKGDNPLKITDGKEKAEQSNKKIMVLDIENVSEVSKRREGMEGKVVCEKDGEVGDEVGRGLVVVGDENNNKTEGCVMGNETSQKEPLLIDPKTKLKRYKRTHRQKENGGQLEEKGVGEKRRRGCEMEVEDEAKQKRARDTDVDMNQAENDDAGLSEQLREQK
jgi:hypothetical protein